MNKQLFVFFIIINLSLLLYNCNRNSYTKSNFPEACLSFGSGGGFTGTSTNYHLLPNGQIFKSEGFVPDTLAYTNIKRSAAKKLFKAAANSSIKSIEFEHPGNRYHHLTYQENVQSYKVVWRARGQQLVADLDSLNQALQNSIKTHISQHPDDK